METTKTQTQGGFTAAQEKAINKMIADAVKAATTQAAKEKTKENSFVNARAEYLANRPEPVKKVVKAKEVKGLDYKIKEVKKDGRVQYVYSSKGVELVRLTPKTKAGYCVLSLIKANKAAINAAKAVAIAYKAALTLGTPRMGAAGITKASDLDRISDDAVLTAFC